MEDQKDVFLIINDNITALYPLLGLPIGQPTLKPETWDAVDGIHAKCSHIVYHPNWDTFES